MVEEETKQACKACGEVVETKYIEADGICVKCKFMGLLEELKNMVFEETKDTAES